ncbi:RsmE family RNA methyltransferase [Xylocopilactobacillus apicola]|uniref:Ribosomal RNA small subunit methyltransferase E n=1 Tax=Xylocopilactobacillus apicola TaxID=2932184 RepID=A0AAU9DSA5_9LACO|nr:RsmE family RNA methyltransferase [Xylocopilactobacillus apicola]BDR58118.1 ribosomal RNA small subunit methyltransferase E [Xylocopilactobacillus apicola]
MQRVFIDNNLDSRVVLTGEEYHHLAEVLRYQPGKTFEVADTNGQVAVYELSRIDIDQKQLHAKRISENSRNSELPVEVTLICALTKGKKIDETVEKGTEFGASHFVFYPSKFSPLKYSDEWGQKKEERLNKIALSAAKQSHRNVVPSVEIVRSWSECDLDAQIKFLAYEKTDPTGLNFKASLDKLSPGTSVCCAFGPEGGYDVLEVDEFIDHGFQDISLGQRILRAENAPIFFLSVLSFYFEL